VLDLREHAENWVRDKLGDRWLGFTDEKLRAMLHAAGFDPITLRVGARRSGDPFTVLVAAGTVPARTGPANLRVRRSDRAPKTTRGPKKP